MTLLSKRNLAGLDALITRDELCARVSQSLEALVCHTVYLTVRRLPV